MNPPSVFKTFFVEFVGSTVYGFSKNALPGFLASIPLSPTQLTFQPHAMQPHGANLRSGALSPRFDMHMSRTCMCPSCPRFHVNSGVPSRRKSTRACGSSSMQSRAQAASTLGTFFFQNVELPRSVTLQARNASPYRHATRHLTGTQRVTYSPLVVLASQQSLTSLATSPCTDMASWAPESLLTARHTHGLHRHKAESQAWQGKVAADFGSLARTRHTDTCHADTCHAHGRAHGHSARGEI